MIPALLFVLNLVLGAWGLPLAEGMARTWARLYTRFVPAEQRERRLLEIESDLFDQIEADRAAGYRPNEIALRIVPRVVWASPPTLPGQVAGSGSLRTGPAGTKSWPALLASAS